MQFDRRSFLRSSAALAALAGADLRLKADTPKTATKTAKKGDANDKRHVAVIGVHGRGRDHVQELLNPKSHLNCVITTICDADEAVVGPAMRMVEKAQGKAPRFEQDLRKVMDDKSIDIVTIATPNHWHALAAIWGLQAGKDVYVEKPVSHNVSEGRRIVETARKLKRICQTGTQSRSSSGLKDAMEFLHSGRLGKVYLARGLCYKLRPSIGHVTSPQSVPSTVNYDLWTGPAAMQPLMRKHLHYDWHWVWEYGNGDLGNQGIHEMDKARWGLGKNELARSVLSVGGRFGYVDDGQTANTQICLFDYGDCELLFEVRGLPSRSPYPGKDFGKKSLKPTNHVGNIWYGTEGYMVCGNYSGAIAYDLKGEEIRRFTGGGNHFENFFKAVRSRNHTELNADILQGHLSSALCHLGNVSYRLGTPQPLSQKSKAFGDDKDAYETLARMEEHLKENGVPVDSTSYQIGRKLAFDPASERFVNDSEADGYLTRHYREGFVVPAKV
jgi:predicted dehydrogenase